MLFTAEELEELARFDDEIDAEYDGCDEDAYDIDSDELRALIAEREQMGDLRRPRGAGAHLTTEQKAERTRRLGYLNRHIKYLQNPELHEERNKKSRDRHRQLVESGKLKYDPVKRHEEYLRSIDRCKRNTQDQLRREKWKRTHPKPEEVNAHCWLCGAPLCIPNNRMNASKSGIFYCNNTCRTSAWKKKSAEKQGW